MEDVIADEESFTAGVRHAIHSMASTQVTAVSSLDALAAAADSAARATLQALNVPDRQRHSRGCRKRARSSGMPRDQDHSHRKTQVTVFAPGSC